MTKGLVGLIKRLSIRLFLSGTLLFPLFSTEPLYAGEYSPKRQTTQTLEDGRKLVFEPDAEYTLRKTFDLGDRRDLIVKVDIQKNTASRGFIIKDSSGKTLRRITYDIRKVAGKDRLHMNLTKFVNGKEVSILKNKPFEIPISSGTKQEKILRSFINLNKYSPKTPSKLAGKKYLLDVIPRGGSKVYQRLPNKSSLKLISSSGIRRATINPSSTFKNTIRVTKASRSRLPLEGLVTTSLSDGPEFGPVDVLLSLWLMYESVQLYSEMTSQRTNIDFREQSRILKIRCPELFEADPLYDVSPITGHTIIKNKTLHDKIMSKVKDHYAVEREKSRRYLAGNMDFSDLPHTSIKQAMDEVLGKDFYTTEYPKRVAAIRARMARERK